MINPTEQWYMMQFICWRIQFDGILFNLSTCVQEGYHSMVSCAIFHFFTRAIPASESKWEMFPHLYFLKESAEHWYYFFFTCLAEHLHGLHTGRKFLITYLFLIGQFRFSVSFWIRFVFRAFLGICPFHLRYLIGWHTIVHNNCL